MHTPLSQNSNCTPRSHFDSVERAFAEAVGGLCVANNHLAIEELKEAASRICKAMDHNYHEIGAKAIQFSIFDEEHGRDEFITAYGCKSFGRCLHV